MWDFKRWGENTALLTEDGFKLKYSELERRQKEFYNRIGRRAVVLILAKKCMGEYYILYFLYSKSYGSYFSI